MTYAKEDLEQLRGMMGELLHDHYGIERPDRLFRCLSPYHDDPDPSSKYYKDTNLVYCQGCGKTWDVFSLVGETEHIPEGDVHFPERVRKAAALLGVQIGEGVSKPTPKRPHRPSKPSFSLPGKAGFTDSPMLKYAFMMGMCLESDVAMAYLRSRGFDEDTAFRNVVGYVPSLDDEKLKNDDGGKLFTYYDPSRPRGYLVIPYPSDETFCRVNYCMVRAIPGKAAPKSKELRPSGYHSPLYREYLLHESPEVLYIVEGLLDSWAMEAMCGRDVLALGSTSMVGRLANVLYATTPSYRPGKLILALDADDGGKKATEKLVPKLRHLGIPFTIMEYPPGCKDACDMLMAQGGGGAIG